MSAAIRSNPKPYTTTLIFTVRKFKPELIKPARPTPRDIKPLSDIDDQDSLRFQIPVIHFYRKQDEMGQDDPAKVIKAALSEALVYYYPFAGRLREVGPSRKLVVDCTGEGLVFVEAEADISLEDFGVVLQPPFPCLEELLFDVPGTSAVLHCPLILVQITRLKCGGFIVAHRLNHTMSDAGGLVLFMNAVAEIARGATRPSISPVWDRQLLDAPVPPRVTCSHREYDEVEDAQGTIIPLDDMVHRSFLFGQRELSVLRRHLPLDLQSKCSSFEVLAACLWRCRTLALQPHPEEEVRALCLVNAKSKFKPQIPNGYYGNVFAFSVAISTAREISENPLSYALKLVKKAKETVTEEYMKSLASLMVLRRRPHFTVVRSYLISDLSHAGFEEIDYGWGKPVYGGPAKGGVGAIPGVASFLIPHIMAEGERQILVPVCLPALAMEKFVHELGQILGLSQDSCVNSPWNKVSATVRSSL